MNIYAFKPHLSFWVPSWLIICYWFPYRTVYICFNFKALSLPLWFMWTLSLFLFPFFLFLQALLGLCRSVGYLLFTVWLVTLYKGGILIIVLISSQSQVIFSSTDWIMGRLGHVVCLNLDCFNTSIFTDMDWLLIRNTDLGVIDESH